MENITLKNVKDFSYSMKEALRALKKNVQFCGDDVKVIVFTSPMPNEGKSTLTFNLARSLSESGKSILLIDTDMRKSVLVGRLRAKTNNREEIMGLSHYLSGQCSLSEVVYKTQIAKLCMIFAGPSVPNPTEILEKKYFGDMIASAREQFDYVLIDCAPIGAAIDAAVVAKHADGTVIVTSQGQTERSMLAYTKKQLDMAGVKILGAVLNRVKMEKGHYGKYYGNYYGSYYGNY
ncbi:MAG: CpsD/CapB family tyrosine-protein kinase [Wujia sp.]